MQRVKLLVGILFVLVTITSFVLPRPVVAASNRNTSVWFGCQWFSLWYDLTIDRDNSENLHAERLLFRAVDGSGLVIYDRVISFSFSGQPRPVSGFFWDYWAPRPRYNPLTFQIISLAGNGQPQQTVFSRTVKCSGLPSYTQPSSTPTLVPTLPPTYTPTPVAGNDLTITGKVTDAATANGIGGVNVWINSCHPRAFSTVTAADGTYSLFVPASYNCGTLPIDYISNGYLSYTISDGAAYIAAHGTTINVALTPAYTFTPVPSLPPDYTPTPVPSATVWPSETSLPPTPTRYNSPTPLPTLPPTSTPLPSMTVWPSGTPTRYNSPTPVPSTTALPSRTPTPTPTRYNSPTPLPTLPPTSTPLPTMTVWPSRTPTPTPLPTFVPAD